MATILEFPKPDEPLTPWEWLRGLADKLEKEGESLDVLMTLVIVNEAGDAYRMRSQRYNATRLEAVGMLTTAAFDYNAAPVED